MRSYDMGCVYHISRKWLGDTKILKPRIPNNQYTLDGKEDNTIPRVCFSTTIDGCIAAIGDYLKPNHEYYIYITSGKFYVPGVGRVCDSILTGELWALQPVKVHYYGKLFIKEGIITMPLRFISNNTTNKPIIAKAYNYEVKAEMTETTALDFGGIQMWNV